MIGDSQLVNVDPDFLEGTTTVIFYPLFFMMPTICFFIGIMVVRLLIAVSPQFLAPKPTPQIIPPVIIVVSSLTPKLLALGNFSFMMDLLPISSASSTPFPRYCFASYHEPIGYPLSSQETLLPYPN